MVRRGVALILAVTAVLASAACAAPAPPATPAAGTVASPTGGTGGGWYLALGDSLAAGFQPSTGDQPTRGYAGAVLADVRTEHPGAELRNLGCSGETTTTMISGGRCSYAEGNQLAGAVAFLEAHAASTHLVTLDLGANNVLRCARPAVDQVCAAQATGGVSADLGTVLARLRAAAPQVEIVVLTYYNPLLASWRAGADGQQVARASAPLLAGLNSSIGAAAKTVGARVADVSGAFASDDLTAGASGEPLAVQRVCAWTWMCSQADIHANDDGYAAMAAAVTAVR